MRSALLRLFLGVLALLQGVSPLLHAHVVPPSASGQTGLHLHTIAIAPAQEPGRAESLTLTAQAESAAITAPAEHRRDDLTGRLTPPSPARMPCALDAAFRATDLRSHARGVVLRTPSLRLPPAHGPPAATRPA